MAEDSYKHAKHARANDILELEQEDQEKQKLAEEPELEQEVVANQMPVEAPELEQQEAPRLEQEAKTEVARLEQEAKTEVAQPATEPAPQQPQKPKTLLELYTAGEYELCLAMAGRMLAVAPTVGSVLFGGFAKAKLADNPAEGLKTAGNAVTTAIKFAGQRGAQGVAELLTCMPLSLYVWYCISINDDRLDKIEQLKETGDTKAATALMRAVLTSHEANAGRINSFGLKLIEAMREYQVYDLGSLAMLKLMVANVKSEEELQHGIIPFERAARQFVFDAMFATNETFRTECQQAANARSKSGVAKKPYNDQDVRAAWEMVPDLAGLAG